MSSPFGDRAFPRGPLMGAAGLVLVALLAVSAARLAGMPAGDAPAPAVAARELRFEDRPDGGITVYDARAGERVAVVAAGTGGFLRGALRALTRERRRRGLGPEGAFRLSAHADGRLRLEDPATGRDIDLGAFGPTNAGAFARFLSVRGETP